MGLCYQVTVEKWGFCYQVTVILTTSSRLVAMPTAMARRPTIA
jgi:hypothetical protein